MPGGFFDLARETGAVSPEDERPHLGSDFAKLATEANALPAQGLASLAGAAAEQSKSTPDLQLPPVLGETSTHYAIQGPGGKPMLVAKTPGTVARFGGESAPVTGGPSPMGRIIAGSKLREDALGQTNEAIGKETEANKKLIGLESERLQKRGEGMQANAERQQNDLEVLQNQHEMALNQLEHERQALMSQKVDPNRYWKDKSTGGKVLSAIGLALGTFGSALSHQPNYALDLFKKAIDNDIDAQHAEIAKSKDTLSLRHNLIAERLRQGMSQLGAEASARITMLDAADSMLQSHAGEAKGQLADVQAQKMRAYITDQRGQLEQALGAAMAQAQRGPATPKLSDQLKLRELEVEVPQRDAQGHELPPVTAMAKNESSATRIRQLITMGESTKAEARNLLTMLGNGYESLSPQDRVRAQKAAKRIEVKLSKVFELGVPNAHDQDYMDQLGNPESFLQREGTTEKLTTDLSAAIDRNIRETLKYEGILKHQ